MEKAAQNPENSIAANKYLTDVSDWSNRRTRFIFREAHKYALQHNGRLDVGFDKDLIDAIEKYDDQDPHPVLEKYKKQYSEDGGKPKFGTPMSQIPLTGPTPPSNQPPAQPNAQATPVPMPEQQAAPQVRPAASPSNQLPIIMKNAIERGVPGPDITTRARTGLGLPRQAPPLGPLSTYTSDVTAKAREHPEGMLLPLGALGAQSAAGGVRAFLQTSAGKAVAKYILEGMGLGAGIGGTEEIIRHILSK
jgi:hypothetical protein